MQNNTVVVACDSSYFWGVFILIASMRMNGMDEPMLVFQRGFTAEMCSCLKRFGGMKIVEATPSGQNMTCRKAEAMLLVDTEYISWVDCDGFFIGNCSQLLVSPDPDEIHLRLRTAVDNGKAFRSTKQYAAGDTFGSIPQAVLDIWRKNIGERTQPRLTSCASACFFSLNRKHRDFLEKFDWATKKFLPSTNLGVVNQTRRGYYQLDESVLNCLLCFMDNPPLPTKEFALDKNPEKLFVHIIGSPKPWQWWNSFSIRHYNAIMKIIAYAVSSGYATLPLPMALQAKYKFLHRHTLWVGKLMQLRSKLKHKIKKIFKGSK